MVDMKSGTEASSNPEIDPMDMESNTPVKEAHSEAPKLSKPVLPFNYEVLPTQTSFRLLDLEANLSIDPHTELTCSLCTYELRDAPSFRALSYTWGPPYQNAMTGEIDDDPNIARHISCSALNIPITYNLFGALWTLREAKITGWLWVDALCINQEDLKERESQVSLMGQIYSSATEVIVWLGPPRFGLDDFVWATTEFLTALSTVGKKLQASGESPASLYKTSNLGDPSFHRTLGIEHPVPRLIRLAQFCASCRWFSRAWIIQEFLLARHVRAFSGHVELSLSRLGELAWILRSTGWGPMISQLIAQHNNLKRFHWLEEPLRWHAVTNTSRPRVEDIIRNGMADDETAFHWLWITLSLSRVAKCQDRRDHIYSILGLAGRCFVNNPITHYIKPSYNISLEDLLTLVAIRLSEHSRYIDVILSDVDSCSENAHLLKLPSWVPNYCSPSPAWQPLIGFGGGTAFDAALCLSFGRSERSLSMTTMTCSGAVFGTMQEVHKFKTAKTCGVRSLLEFCLSMPQEANGRRRLEIFWRTMIADTTSEGHRPAPPSSEKGFLAHTKVLFTQWVLESTDSDKEIDPDAAFEGLHSILDKLGFSDAPDEQLTMKDMRDHYERLKLKQSLHGDEQKVVAGEISNALKMSFSYAHAEGRISQGRELFITEQGFLGLGPSNVRKGDQVWLLRDSRVPFVLRPVAETSSFTLVGECYIHGFMHGEMLDDQWGLEDKIQPVNIV
ncbi:heterokaryon incompatibility protein-domain-containing protein [Bisporella sp. PMI_857]|nr:heterokaryon incompatibility protein-domain-containing protein [Bisporella sp. PMI_857]